MHLQPITKARWFHFWTLQEKSQVPAVIQDPVLSPRAACSPITRLPSTSLAFHTPSLHTLPVWCPKSPTFHIYKAPPQKKPSMTLLASPRPTSGPSSKCTLPSPLVKAFLVVQTVKVKNPPVTQETRVWSLDGEDPPEDLATRSSILAWRIPWTEEPGDLCSPRACKELTWLRD